MYGYDRETGGRYEKCYYCNKEAWRDELCFTHYEEAQAYEEREDFGWDGAIGLWG